MVLELRKSNKDLRRIFGSNLVGKVEISWKAILESPDMVLKEWVKIDLVGGNDCKEEMLKPFEVQGEEEVSLRRDGGSSVGVSTVGQVFGMRFESGLLSGGMARLGLGLGRVVEFFLGTRCVNGLGTVVVVLEDGMGNGCGFLQGRVSLLRPVFGTRTRCVVGSGHGVGVLEDGQGWGSDVGHDQLVLLREIYAGIKIYPFEILIKEAFLQIHS
ncbi:unnamed protein product [Lupinus luteus]|uniref:Uncharacterized protein n=1 Tax=Lupinus luteus TaxID=3873 RepID=A0AAV1W7M8_LUPLU